LGSSSVSASSSGSGSGSGSGLSSGLESKNPVSRSARMIEEDMETRDDVAFVMSVAAQDRMKIEQLYPTDRFMTKTKLKQLKDQRRPKYSMTVIRVIFDSVVIRANFGSSETVENLFQLISDRLIESDKPFSFLIPPVTKITRQNASKTFSALELVPAAMMYFKWESGAPVSGILKAEVYAARSSEDIPEQIPSAINKEAIDALKRQEEMDIKRAEKKQQKNQSKFTPNNRDSKSEDRKTKDQQNQRPAPKWIKK